MKVSTYRSTATMAPPKAPREGAGVSSKVGRLARNVLLAAVSVAPGCTYMDGRYVPTEKVSGAARLEPISESVVSPLRWALTPWQSQIHSTNGMGWDQNDYDAYGILFLPATVVCPVASLLEAPFLWLEKMATGTRVDWEFYNEFHAMPPRRRTLWKAGVDYILEERRGQMDWPLFKRSWADFRTGEGGLWETEIVRIIQKNMGTQATEV